MISDVDNEVGDEGCVAMAQALSDPAQETLELIDLSGWYIQSKT
jgi:hypothetical protein